MASFENFFVELTAKTNYSFLEGASHPEEMIEQAARLGFTAIGITDRNGVYAIPKAHRIANQCNILLIIGAELALETGGHLYLLAQNGSGYGNLCELLTWVHRTHKETKVPFTQVLEKNKDLFILLPVSTIQDNQVLQAKETFGDRAFGLVSHFFDGQNYVPKAQRLSQRFSLPCVASNEPLFHSPHRKPIQDILTCIRHQCSLRCAGFKLLPNSERYLKSQKQMWDLFSDHPQWLENSVGIAQSCSFSLNEIRYKYPIEWIPPGETAESFLEKLVWCGAEQRYPFQIPSNVKKQIRDELKLIEELKYCDYFLTTWDIVQFARSKNILCQGRGSAANSIVCYLLGITAIDPVRMELLFERFISRERKEPPDIDIDFEHERREEVIQYLYQKYGRERAAITAETICFRRRSALREVGKVFEIGLPTVEKYLALTHEKKPSKVTVEELLAADSSVSPRTAKLYLSCVRELIDFPRHLGTHVGGFVLSQGLLCRSVPIENAAMPDRTVIQWDKDDLDLIGFVKVDVLGLGILTCIRKALEYLQSTYGISMTLATIPPEDPKVYTVIAQADTVGVFQIESRAQMNMLPRLKPKNFFDLVVEIALVRPGPIQGEMVHPYLHRRSGQEKVRYPHPSLQKILEKTYGVPIFQEQIMKVAMEVAGFSGGEADNLRRAMGTWRKDGGQKLNQIAQKIQERLIRRGIDTQWASKIYHQIEGFAEYGFPESHAASFAILAYASAYLKIYHPNVFLCALLNSQPMGFYSIHTLIHDAQRHAVKVLPIDITKSKWDSSLEENGAVRLGLRQVRGLSKRVGHAIEDLSHEQSTWGKDLTGFVLNLKQLLSPTALSKRDLFYLAAADAFKAFGLSRREALWEIQALPLQDVCPIFEQDDKVQLPSEDPWEKTLADYESCGVSLSSHPMAYLRKGRPSLLTSKQCHQNHRKRVQVAGLVISRQMPPTASGVLFITLEDEYGFINLVICRPIYEKYKEVLISESLIICEGRIEKASDGNVYHIIVESVWPLQKPGAILTAPAHNF